MTSHDCDVTRDVLPLAQRGECSAAEAAAAAAHVEACGECSVFAQLIREVALAAEEVPTGLQSRVAGAVASRTARRWAPARLAVAATVAAAIIGGTVVFDRWGYDLAPASPGAIVFDDSTTPIMSWGVTDDPLLSTGLPLQQLSLEELELVLAELDT